VNYYYQLIPFAGSSLVGYAIGFENADYEPIILIYETSTLCYLVTRKHWRYNIIPLKRDFVCLHKYFLSSFHAPLPLTNENEVIWNLLKRAENLQSEEYEFKTIKPNDIEDTLTPSISHVDVYIHQ
jgi:hypothetical protein